MLSRKTVQEKSLRFLFQKGENMLKKETYKKDS
jgi:hypothetical protein